MVKVLIDYPMSDKAIAMLSEEGLECICIKRPLSEGLGAVESLGEDLRAEVNVMIGDALTLNEGLTKLLPNLKWFHHFAAGLSGQRTFNWELVEKHGIAITNSKIQSLPVSELAVAMLLGLYKRLPAFFRYKADKVFESTAAVEMLYDKTFLIVGTGNIGAEIGRKLKIAFGAKILGINEFGENIPHFDETADLSKLDSYIPRADALILSCPHTPQTHHMLDARRFNLFKPSAVLVNAARGQLIVQQDLIEALRSGRLGGAGLDVFEEEPLPLEDPLWEIPNVIITPHIAGHYPNYSEGIVRAFLNNLPFYLSGKAADMPDYANKRRY